MNENWELAVSDESAYILFESVIVQPNYSVDITMTDGYKSNIKIKYDKYVHIKTIDEINNAFSENAHTVITVDDVQKALKIFEDDKSLIKENEKIEMNSPQTILLTCSTDRVPYFNKLLVMNDIVVSGIKTEGGNLEDYYVEKVGEAK